MAASRNYQYQQAASIVKIQGILSIIFGGIGVVMGFCAMSLIALAMSVAYTDADALVFFMLFILTLIFWFIPHVYFIVAGVTLYRLPDPRVVKVLTIVNLVVGVFWNVVLLIFAIIALIQSAEYETGYKRE